ncbi:hypothetical protein DUNSADRAFT_16880 [Dunaliella salina]|uniref:Uncharacterized protein n=1 Tax=Dunaliella salina TaxID=3046 RepID=A0ABQ7H960_DUNSA|nr:hypothetical protein DUNSADRAFT_16880 [Dunaliella salina]|eukprot:KAF5843381.1 hypothetical protein DUNSADRAFT_16880 [Dunaliella salina]
MSILEYSTACMGRSSTAGIPSTASSMHLKQWLSRVTSLLVDKNLDLRKRASEALEAVYRDVDAHTVVAFAHHSTGAEGLNGPSTLSSLSSQPQQQQQQQQHGSDPAAQARLLSLLAHRLASAPSDDTLLQLADLAGQAILPAVLVCEADASKEVMLAASHAVACLVLAAPPQRVIDILSAMLPSSPPLATSHPHSQPLSTPQGGSHPGLVVQNALDAEERGEVACAACRCVQRVAHSISAEELGPRIALDLLPGLVRACDHVRADVRKAAVFAIAEMWHKMGDASFAVHLAKLNQQQQHLVSWAYERIRLAASARPPPQ